MSICEIESYNFKDFHLFCLQCGKLNIKDNFLIDECDHFQFFSRSDSEAIYDPHEAELEYPDKTDFAEYLENYFIEGSKVFVFTNESINYELYAVYNFHE